MIQKAWQGFSHFWSTDRGLSIFLTLIVLIVFVLPPLGSLGIVGRLVVDIFFSFLLISGMASLSVKRKGVFVVVAGLAMITLVFRWTDSIEPSPFLAMLDYLATIASIILFCIVILAQVLKKGPITFRRIQGAIAVYLLLGLAWAHAYELIEYISPGAFAGNIYGSGRFSSWMYFSFVTLATLGYGDIAPIQPLARSLAVAEAITGQLYLAILIARLVSQELIHREGTRGKLSGDSSEN
jgi:voltage-gated potassium channel Kch